MKVCKLEISQSPNVDATYVVPFIVLVCHYSCHFQCAKKVPYPCPTSSDKSRQYNMVLCEVKCVVIMSDFVGMRLSGIDPKKGIGTAYEGWVKVRSIADRQIILFEWVHRGGTVT